jgi:hypothetical protein
MSRLLSCLAGLALALAPLTLAAQEPVVGEPPPASEERRYSIGLLPAVDYSPDKGFGYGVVFQLDDKRGPDYAPYFLSHRILLQRTTKGIADYQYRFDSKYLLPARLRLTLEARYQVSRLEPYHGPGGAQTLFDQDFIDEDSPRYRGKFYYAFDKRYYLLNAVVQGPLGSEGLRWLAGLVVLDTKVDTVDYADFDEDPALDSLLANHTDLLGEELEGGRENGLLVGLVSDRRDHEVSPHRGFWSEGLVRWVPDGLGNDFDYTSLTVTHRHYLPLLDPLTLAVRASGRVMSEGAPFFTRSRLDGSFNTETVVGGKKTVRGIVWQRALGNDFLYGNAELRFRFARLFDTGYLAASTFYDLGRTFDEAPPESLFDRGDDQDRWHQGVGLGLRVALHDTFVVALDAALAVDPDLDGPGTKIYIGLDWLF